MKKVHVTSHYDGQLQLPTGQILKDGESTLVNPKDWAKVEGHDLVQAWIEGGVIDVETVDVKETKEEKDPDNGEGDESQDDKPKGRGRGRGQS